MRLLLLSNSTNHGEGYLDHAEAEIRSHFQGTSRLLFVPFALHDQEGYARRAGERMAALGIAVDRLEEGAHAARVVQESEAIFVGGGNTFRLLDRLQRCGALPAIRDRVRQGIPYMGASAGTVIAAPTIKTTNDMPIVAPASLASLGLVPFQINCHYLDADPSSRHMGETRDQRLAEFLEENDTIVVGLREGSMLQVATEPGKAPRVRLAGRAGARLFRRGASPSEHAPGADLAQAVGWSAA